VKYKYLFTILKYIIGKKPIILKCLKRILDRYYRTGINSLINYLEAFKILLISLDTVKRSLYNKIIKRVLHEDRSDKKQVFYILI
jgi:hypothetical protein